jgi:hypothetical protein
VIALLITFSLVTQFHAENPDWSETPVWTISIITGVLFFACLLAHELSHAVVAKAARCQFTKLPCSCSEA